MRYIYDMEPDDVINFTGFPLSTRAMEEVLASHKDIAEWTMIGVLDNLRGELSLGFIVLKSGFDKEPKQIVKEVVGMVSDQIYAFTCLRRVTTVKRLLKTRSGKILRSTMRKIANGEHYDIPSAIDVILTYSVR